MTSNVVASPTKKSLDDDNTNSKYHLYGWKNLRIGGILSRPLFAYIILCACNFIQNFTVNGANNAVISTLERVFYLDSVQSGLFLALYDVATVFSSPFVGYFGSRYSSPMFFSLNMIIVGFGNFLIGSSNFVYRDTTYNFNPEVIQYLSAYDNVLFQCYKDPFDDQNITDTACLRQEHLSSTSQNAKLLLYMGNFVNGIGSVALFTIGIAYIERIFPRDKAAYCQGIYFAVGTVGGALGIVATGRFLLLYTKITPKRRLPPWLTPTHPLWIGCWWLPYLIYGGLCLVIGLFVSGLPNFEKPGKKHPGHTHVSTSSAQTHPNALNISISRADSPTSVTMISTCPPTPALRSDSPDSKSKFNNKLPAVKAPFDEYRLSNRKLRQLSPLEQKPKASSSLTSDGTSNGFINHAYSTESIYNQLPTGDPVPPTSPTPTIAVSPLPEIRKQTKSESFRHMCSVIAELLKNTRYVFIIIASLFEGILIKGFVPFITKYFEYQHQLDTSTATLVTGAIALISVIVGCPIGAYFMNKFSWTPMSCARVCGIVFTMSSFLFLFLILSCPELKFQQTSCSIANARCCHSIYHPVCNINDYHTMYLSPCHYGCTNQTTIADNNTNFYSSCNCAADPTVILSETACRFRRIPCVMIFALTMTGAAFVVFFTAFIQVPMLQVLLYSVPLQYQSMALGLRQTIVRVLGQTTGPLLYGFVFDQSCLVWLTDCYGRRTCKVYNNRLMGLSMALSGFSTRIISGIACGVVFFNWKFKHSNEVVAPPANILPRVISNSINNKEKAEMTKL